MRRLIKSATLYYHDDKPELFFCPDPEYGAVITRIKVDMGQTINPPLQCHLGVKCQTLTQM